MTETINFSKYFNLSNGEHILKVLHPKYDNFFLYLLTTNVVIFLIVAILAYYFIGFFAIFILFALGALPIFMIQDSWKNYKSIFWVLTNQRIIQCNESDQANNNVLLLGEVTSLSKIPPWKIHFRSGPIVRLTISFVDNQKQVRGTIIEQLDKIRGGVK